MIWIKWYMIVFVYVPIVIYNLIWLEIMAINKYINRNYTRVKKDKLSFIEIITTFLNILLLSFIPLFNVILLLVIITSGQDRIIEIKLKEGKIIPKEKD